MSTCDKCGNPIDFRYVNGRCIPMHLYGSCIGSSSRATDYSGYNTSHESMCFSTTCPRCGDGVFFVRHNGGSVWLDLPLGWPWYKHGCFYTDEISSGIYESSLVSAEIEQSLTENPELEIGVVKRTWVEPNKNYTDIVLDNGESDAKEIRVKNNAGFLLGKLCVLNPVSEEIWPFYEPEYLFTLHDPEKHKYVIPPPIVKPPKRPRYEIVPGHELVKCSVCHCELLKKNLNKHMRKVHKNANK
ncbi:hypothetical protein QYQ40_26830 (plasmid) [Klebsiella pneumoniae]|uniref:hypothetical protein n=1 Tax=Gammaproteobacteria TaxID=1236 RepID=UPI00265A0F50|nr:hypothetical protein [Klebsiella pneumoniae]WKH88807.1 hypothetical protein QYQ40_26830 [Klebsiella pneumoniae]